MHIKVCIYTIYTNQNPSSNPSTPPQTHMEHPKTTQQNQVRAHLESVGVPTEGITSRGQKRGRSITRRGGRWIGCLIVCVMGRMVGGQKGFWMQAGALVLATPPPLPPQPPNPSTHTRLPQQKRTRPWAWTSTAPTPARAAAGPSSAPAPAPVAPPAASRAPRPRRRRYAGRGGVG